MIYSPDRGNIGSVPFFQNFCPGLETQFGDMSSYFDEHDCTPLADGTAPDELLQFARFEKLILKETRIRREFIEERREKEHENYEIIAEGRYKAPW